jgi:hypothetical protein
MTRAAICDSCGGRFDMESQLLYCPHIGNGLAPGVVEAYRGDDQEHALKVAHDVSEMLKGWRAKISDADGIRSGLEVERLRSTPISVAVEREAAAAPDGSYLGHSFTIVVRCDPAPKFRELVLDRLPNEIEGLSIFCELKETHNGAL